MKKLTFKKYNLVNKYNNLLIFILIFMTIFIGRDTLVCNDLIGFNQSQFITLFMFVFYGILFLITNKDHIKEIFLDIRLLIGVLLSLPFIIIMILKQDFTFTYLSMIFAIVCTIFLSYFVSFEQIAKYFTYTILFLTTFSLIANYLLRDFVFQNNNIPILINSAKNEFINLLFTFIYKQDHYYRNFCIFREPGVFQYFLIFALLFETFIIKHSLKIKILFILILSLGMLSTFSTTGFIELVLYFALVFILYFKKIFNTKRKILILTIGMFFFVVCFSFALYKNKDLYWTFKPMITKLYTLNSSLTARLDSVIVNSSIFFKHPLIGDTVYNVLNGARHNTSSTLIMFSMFGFLVGTLYFLVWCTVPYLFIKNKNFIRNKFLKYISIFILFLIIFISFNSENIITNLYFVLIPLIFIIDNLKYMIMKGQNNENIVFN